MTLKTLRIALLAGLASVTASAGATSEAPDAAFLSARAAFEANSRGRLSKLVPELEGHLLAPYVLYWDLFLRLPDAADEEVGAYLSRNAGGVLAEQLRGDWLRVLAKSGRWERFRAEYPAYAGDDPELVCYDLLSRVAREEEVEPEAFRALWVELRELPEGCATLARTLIKAGQLGTDDVWLRFRAQVRARLVGGARRTMEFLPRGEAIDSWKFTTVVRSPARFLRSARVEVAKPAERELAIAALTLAAADDPVGTAEVWEKRLADGFGERDRNDVWAMLAMAGARRHVLESLGWFDRTGDLALSDTQLAWRARIALRGKNWAQVRISIDRMSPASKNRAVWTYWYGRAEQGLGNPLEARGYFEKIADEHGFYGRLAAEELGRALKLPPPAPAPSEEELAAAAAIPGLARALALYRLDMRTEATREWLWTIRGMSDRKLLAAAELARRNEAWDRAIGTADRTVEDHDFSVRYLAPYREVLAQRARMRDLEEPLVLGVVRQESRFITQAKSSNGAAGLMQVMRRTASWAASRMRMKNFSWSRVSDPDYNAALGTYYLRHVLDRFDGSLVLAAAAYNAGPSRARKWRGSEPVEGAIFAETIPFFETRDYVKKVLSNTVYYAAVLGGEQIPLKARLGTVRPAGTGAEEEEGDAAEAEPVVE